MQIGVSSYSYSRLMSKGGFDLFDAIDHASKTGFTQIELVDITPPEGESIMDFAKRLRNHAGEKAIKIAALMISADFLSKPDEAERIKSKVDVAEALGVGMMRHDAAWGHPGGYREAVGLIAPKIREVAEYAGSKGIKTMCENHGFFLQDSYRMEYLFDMVNHPNFGLLADMGNFLCADEEPLTAIARVAPYTLRAHAKDFLLKDGAGPSPGSGWFSSRGGRHLRGTVVGHGVVPVAQCIGILKKAGFTRDISLEFEGPEDVLFAIEAGYTFLKAIC